MGMLQVVKALWGLKKRARLTRPQMLDYQTEKLRILVRHAWRESSFYRDYYSDHGLKETDVGDITVRDLPFTDKEMLMENFDRAVTDAELRKTDLEAFIEKPLDGQTEYLGRYIVFHTSGSSGNVGIFVHDMPSWAIYQAGYPARVMNADRFSLSHNRAVLYGAIHGRFAGIALARAQPRLLVTVLTLSVQAPITKTVEALNDFQPTVLGGYASGIAALSREALAGRLNISPRMVGTCAETLTEEMYSDIEEAWPHRQTDAYASSEFPFVAARLCGRSVYSVHDDVNILELLDSRDQPVTEGQTGNVVLTNLHNRPLPLIRYRMLDMADRGPDEEEGPFSTVIRFHGRVNDALPILLDNGQHGTLSPIVLCGFAVRGIQKAKFVLSAPNRIEVHYTGERDTDGVVSDEFRKVLAASGAARAMEVVVRRVAELPVDSCTGKFRITELQTS